MIGRAVTAFRKSVVKSKSSTALADGNEKEDESVISDDSLPINVRCQRESETSNALTPVLWLKKQRRSQSVNREGDN